MDESCHTLPRVMSRVCMSHVTHRHNCYVYNKLQRTATRCNALQSTAMHCSTLQHTAAHCNILRHTATHCNTLQQIATYCNTLRHTAAQCSTLQSHIWMSHVILTLSHVPHIKESSRHPYEWVTSHNMSDEPTHLTNTHAHTHLHTHTHDSYESVIVTWHIWIIHMSHDSHIWIIHMSHDSHIWIIHTCDMLCVDLFSIYRYTHSMNIHVHVERVE